jgi:hypothetical protein
MTLPDERFRSILRTEEFLIDLTDPKKTQKIPRKIREQAVACLRHFPSYYYLKQIEHAAPDIIQEHIEDVDRMMKHWAQRQGIKNAN